MKSALNNCSNSDFPDLTPFAIDEICILCGEKISKSYQKLQQKLPISRRNVIRMVDNVEFKDHILQEAGYAGEWGQDIVLRISNINDLVSAQCRYHHLCRQKLFCTSRSSGAKKGRPEDARLIEGMERIYAYLEEKRDECKISLSDLIVDNFTDDYKPDVRTVEAYLSKRYGEQILITKIGSYHSPILVFRDSCEKIIYESWDDERKCDAAEDRLKKIEVAAKIIIEDINSLSLDTTSYPPSDDFLKDANECVPDSLKLLLESIIVQNKRVSIDDWKKKCTSIGHAIIAAVRSKSFLSSIQIGFGTYLYRKFGSKHLINLCNAMGFCCSYNEATRVESSAILREESSQMVKKGAFMQFVWDNADVNVNTLDGANTFHEMGGVMIITPHSSVISDKRIPRLKYYVSAETIASQSTVELKNSNMKKKAGLSAISIADIAINKDLLPTAPDLLWLFGKSRNLPDIPGWNGFMEQATEGLPYKLSKVVFLPFIHAPPTDYDTILTSLLEASRRTIDHGQKTCIVTYDQPLYLKARDIVENCQNPQLSNVVVRLGGFHILMSFMGAIGTIMAGSGLKEILSSIYAENSVDKILQGHAYSRAVRAHLLTNLALTTLILNDKIEFTEEEVEQTEKLILECDRKVIMHAAEEESVKSMSVKLNQVYDKLEQQSPTSKLWVQYCKMTTLMKRFIQAERMGDWHLHIDSVKSMLPFFHAAGHFPYAKSARLYVQDMSNLEVKMEEKEFKKFTAEGEFAVHRSDKFWSGLWTDLTIEQVLMRSMKSQGGLTHGRGISNSVLSRWTGGMVSMLNICEEVELFWKISSTTSEEHVDMRPARIERDGKDVKILISWFQDHMPFTSSDKLISIYSGVIGGTEVNCHRAQELGCDKVMKIVGETFGNVTFKMKDKVQTLAHANIKIHNKPVWIDPLSIFQRLCIIKQSEDDLKHHFSFELAPYPLSLFTDEGMRKGTKSTFFSAFTPQKEKVNFGERTFCVVDGGNLLHKVVWPRESSVKQIVAAYITYTMKHYGSNISVIFDGYPNASDEKNTKCAERRRRYSGSECKDILFEETTIIKVPQQKFLSNDKNKQRLIEFICKNLVRKGINFQQAPEDADTLIVSTALGKSGSYDQVIIAGEDIDLLVILNGLGYAKQNVFFQKNGRGESDCEHFCSTSFNRGSFPPGMILFFHAFTGCDSTSAVFGQGKMKMVGVLSRNKTLIDASSKFLKHDSTHEEIASAGKKCLVALYGGKEDESLHALRYFLFIRSAASTKVILARLPPTEEAAAQHSFRTYHQVQKWLGNEKEPTDWGWMRNQHGLSPVTTTKEPAPLSLLKMLSCKCQKGCRGNNCSCQRSGLKCSLLCKFCRGKTCKNTPDIEMYETEEEDDDASNNLTSRKKNAVDENEINPMNEPGPSKKFRVL